MTGMTGETRHWAGGKQLGLHHVFYPLCFFLMFIFRFRMCSDDSLFFQTFCMGVYGVFIGWEGSCIAQIAIVIF